MGPPGATRAHVHPYGPFMGPYGPIWTHMGSIWAHMGPRGPRWAHTGPHGPRLAHDSAGSHHKAVAGRGATLLGTPQVMASPIAEQRGPSRCMSTGHSARGLRLRYSHCQMSKARTLGTDQHLPHTSYSDIGNFKDGDDNMKQVRTVSTVSPSPLIKEIE